MRSMNESKKYYSPDEVAELLGLHVRTVRRFIREGKVRASQVGRQYRIAEADLGALVETAPAQAQPRGHRTTVAATVDIDAIGRAERDRLTALLAGAFHSLAGEPSDRRLDSIYYEQESRLRVIINADIGSTQAMLGMIQALLESGEGG